MGRIDDAKQRRNDRRGRGDSKTAIIERPAEFLEKQIDWGDPRHYIGAIIKALHSPIKQLENQLNRKEEPMAVDSKSFRGSVFTLSKIAETQLKAVSVADSLRLWEQAADDFQIERQRLAANLARMDQQIEAAEIPSEEGEE